MAIGLTLFYIATTAYHVTSMCWSCDLRCPSVRPECADCTSEETAQRSNKNSKRNTGERNEQVYHGLDQM